jgi:hypothetical protein
MKLLEMFDTPVAGMQDVDQDNSKPTWKASRKTKLTFKQIRKLRKMLDVRQYERQQHLKKVRKQYGAKAEDGVPSI